MSHLINSVLYKDAMEIIAVDGGSTDGSQEKNKKMSNVALIQSERKSNK
jgi:glycosyltransferase involved in cell wall biosynthesis